GTAGITLGGYIVSRLVKWHPFKGMPVALTALIGFPGDYILCEEVSRSIARTEEEEKTIFNELLAPMLIGGFTTVTAVSIVIASILVETLYNGGIIIGKKIFENGLLIDGNGGEAKKGDIVVVDGNTIEYVGEKSGYSKTGDEEVVDVQGGT